MKEKNKQTIIVGFSLLLIGVAIISGFYLIHQMFPHSVDSDVEKWCNLMGIKVNDEWDWATIMIMGNWTGVDKDFFIDQIQIDLPDVVTLKKSL